MRAVWSFWSKPFAALRHSAWLSEKHHLLAWVLSTMTARLHYPATALYTDDAGARLLIDGIGLEFDHVSTALNALNAQDPEWWALGKLYSYSLQTDPFVHIDNDVFLWHPLSPDPGSVAVLAQNPEYLSAGHFYYRPEAFEKNIASGGGWLPVEWRWYRINHLDQRGDCCGVFGGSRVDFIQHYATQAIRLMEEPRNRAVWYGVPDKSEHNLLFEQYLLAACLEYHRNSAQSPYRDVVISYVFSSAEEAFNSDVATRLGYTHLLCGAKRDPQLANRVEARVAKDHPAQYRRCIEYLARG
jgi:hypothetical protein